ncbi:TRAP transporter substrate-binding protein DctP [Pusillimonas sp. ANT_WB101]|uniref:TRAP transporter substrate-binding protein DctP n=1 Tax=Pusillimonas sp. ANT_WB101 TaxID=2597356 RepID=UPI0011ECB543|nr:TRAP transporter substrate-binding protein DctP [Pusillimonas sp. ANT_WB101]KAA0889422.1 TRAP transporter substrate-binding protein DctP [Pusillimonas sp. ANT_WB101]
MPAFTTTKLIRSLGVAACGLLLSTAVMADTQKFRISLDTNPSHVRNKGVALFAEELQKRVGDKLAVEVYPSAQLFRDRDVPKALRQGALEMGVPGTWQLEGSEPNAAVTALPMFYGVDPDITHRLMDGELGTLVNGKIEDRLKVKVLGKWADAGSIHFYSTDKAIRSYDDFKGMKIQYSGGTTFAARIEGLGGVPVMIPFSDLPMAMSQGAVEAIASSREGVRTAKLWDSGLKYSFDDYQFMAQYVPLVSERFWKKQPADIQKAIVEAWDVAVIQQREMVAQAESDAALTLKEHGIEAASPDEAARAGARKKLMQTQAALIKTMNIDPESEKLALQELQAASVKF